MEDAFFKIEEDQERMVEFVPALNAEKAKSEIAKYVQGVEKILNMAEAFIIDNNEGNQGATAFMGQIDTLLRDIEEKRKEIIKEPSNFVDTVNGFAKQFTEKLKLAKTALKQKMLSFLAIREQEERKAQLERERAAKELQEKLNKEAEALGTEPVQVAFPILKPRSNVVHTESGSSHIRKNWEYRVVDINLVPDEYRTYCVLDVKIRAAIRGGMREILGLDIFEKVEIVGKRK